MALISFPPLVSVILLLFSLRATLSDDANLENRLRSNEQAHERALSSQTSEADSLFYYSADIDDDTIGGAKSWDNAWDDSIATDDQDDTPPPFDAAYDAIQKNTICSLIASTNFESLSINGRLLGWRCIQSASGSKFPLEDSITSLCGREKPRLQPWTGVTCRNEKIISINLPQASISGSLPANFGQLTSLESLNFANNQLGSSLPASMSSLTNLRNLQLYRNNFGGTLSNAGFGNLILLENLQISWNQLRGSISSSLGSLTRLTTLDLSHNLLTGGCTNSQIFLRFFGGYSFSFVCVCVWSVRERERVIFSFYFLDFSLVMSWIMQKSHLHRYIHTYTYTYTYINFTFTNIILYNITKLIIYM